MDIPTIPGAVYSVVAPTACTITDKVTGRVLATTSPNEQKDFRAFGSVTTLSDPNAIYVAASTFNAAPTIGSGGGGGVTIQFDTTPTQNSTNAVTSGGLYSVLFARDLSLGAGASTSGAYGTALGGFAKAHASGLALGVYANATHNGSLAVGANSIASKWYAIAMGQGTTVKDNSAICFGTTSVNTSSSAVGRTNFYIIPAGSPLAETYENGEACLGYVVKDAANNIVACGTRKLSELLTNNTAFAPAALDLDAPAPTPFLPTGIMDPIEFPEDLTE